MVSYFLPLLLFLLFSLSLLHSFPFFLFFKHCLCLSQPDPLLLHLVNFFKDFMFFPNVKRIIFFDDDFDHMLCFLLNLNLFGRKTWSKNWLCCWFLSRNCLFLIGRNDYLLFDGILFLGQYFQLSLWLGLRQLSFSYFSRVVVIRRIHACRIRVVVIVESGVHPHHFGPIISIRLALTFLHGRIALRVRHRICKRIAIHLRRGVLISLGCFLISFLFFGRRWVRVIRGRA